MGGGSGEITADRVIRIATAAAFIVIALDAIDDALDIAKKGLDNLCDIQERQLNMSQALKDVWLNTQHRMKMKALCEALAMDVPEMSKGTAYDKFKNISEAVSNQAKTALNIWLKQFGVCHVIPCDRTIDIAAMNAAANAGYAHFKFQQRRTERRRNLKYRIVQNAHASSFVEPRPMFDLLNTAANISWSKLQLGLSNLSGAAGLLGVGAGLLSFGNNTQTGNSSGDNFTQVNPGSSSAFGTGLAGGGSFGGDGEASFE